MRTTVAAFPLVAGVLTLMLSFFMVESPYYLVSKDRDEEAAENIRWLLNKKPDEDLSAELASVKKYVNEQRSIDVSDFKSIFLPGNLKLLCTILQIGSPGTICVSTVLYAYGPMLIKDLEPHLNGRTFTLIFGTLRTICQFLSMITVIRFNRFYGMIGCALIQAACAFCFYLERENG